MIECPDGYTRENRNYEQLPCKLSDFDVREFRVKVISYGSFGLLFCED
jgi:hypothetical protein